MTTALSRNRLGVRRRTMRAVVAFLVLGLASLLSYLTLRQAWAWRRYQDAQAALQRQNYAIAADHLARCLDVWPSDRALLLLAARTARRADRFDDARRYQDLCRQRHGDSPELALEWSLLEAHQGRLAEVERPLRRMVVEDHPESSYILEALTVGYITSLRRPEAYHCADSLLVRQPEHAKALTWRGWAQEQARRNKEALADYRRAVTLEPEDPEPRLCLALLLLELQQYPEALEQFQWLRQRHPDEPGLDLGMARCLRGISEVDQARRILDVAVVAFPEEGLILSERGQLALEEGQSEQAERWLRRAVALVPHDRQTHYSLFRCLQLRGRREEAATHLRRAEEIDTDLNRLKTLQKELSKPGPDADRRCEAGLLCQRLGCGEAERYLLGALQDDPRHVPAHHALAEFYQKTGRPNLAARHRAAAAR